MFPPRENEVSFSAATVPALLAAFEVNLVSLISKVDTPFFKNTALP